MTYVSLAPPESKRKPTASIHKDGNLYFSKEAAKLLGITEENRGSLRFGYNASIKDFPPLAVGKPLPAQAGQGANMPRHRLEAEPHPVQRSGTMFYLRVNVVIKGLIPFETHAPRYIIEPSKEYYGEYDLVPISPFEKRSSY